MIPEDTSPEAHAFQIERLKKLGGPGRVALLSAMCGQAREITKAGIRARHPEYSEAQVHLAFSKIILGETLFAEIYPDEKILSP